jgi:hypothetical protein
LRDRDRARQWRRAVVAKLDHPRNPGDDLNSTDISRTRRRSGAEPMSS